MEHPKFSVASVNYIFILRHSVKANASVDSVGDIAEQPFANLLWAAHSDIQGLTCHHCLDSVSSQLI